MKRYGISLTWVDEQHTGAETWMVPEEYVDHVRSILAWLGPPDVEQVIPIALADEMNGDPRNIVL